MKLSPELVKIGTQAISPASGKQIVILHSHKGNTYTVSGFMTRRNDLWIMNSLAFDNVIAINERSAVADSLFQVDVNATNGEGDNQETINNSDTNAILEPAPNFKNFNSNVDIVLNANVTLNKTDITDDSEDTSFDESHLNKDPLLWGKEKDESNANIEEVYRRLQTGFSEKFNIENVNQSDNSETKSANERNKYWKRLGQRVR